MTTTATSAYTIHEGTHTQDMVWWVEYKGIPIGRITDYYCAARLGRTFTDRKTGEIRRQGYTIHRSGDYRQCGWGGVDTQRCPCRSHQAP